MSMRDYSTEGYGVVFTQEMLESIAEQLEPNSNIAEIIGLEEIFSFTGEAITVDENGSDAWSDERISFDNERVCYAPLRNWSTLTSAAYPSMGAAVDELKQSFGEYLPDDFDYLHGIKHIVGVYYG